MASIQNVGTVQSGAGGSITYTCGFTPTSGNLLVFSVASTYDDPIAELPNGTGWSKEITVPASGEPRTHVYWKISDGTESTIVLDWSAGYLSVRAQAYEIGGFSDTPAVDVSATAFTPGPTSITEQSTGTTAASTNDECFALANISSAEYAEVIFDGVDNGFTAGGYDQQLGYAYLDVASSQTFETTFSFSGAGNLVAASACVVVFSVASSGETASGNSIVEIDIFSSGAASQTGTASGNSIVEIDIFSSATASEVEPIVIDHNSTNDNDDEIPQVWLDAGSDQDISWGHQSIGNNILTGLETLNALGTVYNLNMQSGPDWPYPTIDWHTNNNGLSDFPVQSNTAPLSKIDDFERWMDTGQGDLQPSAEELATVLDVGVFKICFVDITAASDVNAIWSAYQTMMSTLAASYPAVKWVWTTCPLNVSGADLPNKATYNALVRNHVNANGGYLWDLADIESHEPDGTPVTDGGNEAMYVGYAVSAGDPHLNATGQVRLARSFHWLLASTAGWDGVSTGNATGEPTSEIETSVSATAAYSGTASGDTVTTIETLANGTASAPDVETGSGDAVTEIETSASGSAYYDGDALGAAVTEILTSASGSAYDPGYVSPPRRKFTLLSMDGNFKLRG